MTWAKRRTKVLTRGKHGHHSKPFRTSKAEIDVSADPDDDVLFTASADDGVLFTASPDDGVRSNLGASSWLSRCPLLLILVIKCGAWYKNSDTGQLKQKKISAPTHTSIALGNLPLLKDSSLDHRMELDPASPFLSCSCLDLAPPGGLNPVNRRLVRSSVRPHVLQPLSLAWPEEPPHRQQNASSGRKRKGSPARGCHPPPILRTGPDTNGLLALAGKTGAERQRHAGKTGA